MYRKAELGKGRRGDKRSQCQDASAPSQRKIALIVIERHASLPVCLRSTSRWFTWLCCVHVMAVSYDAGNSMKSNSCRLRKAAA